MLKSRRRIHKGRRRSVRYGYGRPLFSLTLMFMLCALVCFAAVGIINGNIVTMPDFSDTNGTLEAFGKKVLEVFSGSTGEEEPNIDDIIDKTYLGQVLAVSSATENPFENGCVPVFGKISSAYGYREDPITGKTELHRGLDVTAEKGTPVKAVLDGTVVDVAFSEVGGNYIKIVHTNGFVSYYGHLGDIYVTKEQSVNTGEIIALSSDTGKVTGAHLHFQLTLNDRAVNPSQYFKFDD